MPLLALELLGHLADRWCQDYRGFRLDLRARVDRLVLELLLGRWVLGVPGSLELLLRL